MILAVIDSMASGWWWPAAVIVLSALAARAADHTGGRGDWRFPGIGGLLLLLLPAVVHLVYDGRLVSYGLWCQGGFLVLAIVVFWGVAVERGRRHG